MCKILNVAELLKFKNTLTKIVRKEKKEIRKWIQDLLKRKPTKFERPTHSISISRVKTIGSAEGESLKTKVEAIIFTI